MIGNTGDEELLKMRQEPTSEKVRRDNIKADILLQQFGRAIAPQINKMLADLAAKIEQKQ